MLRNVGGVYSCSCPAWQNQSEPPERRTCKHIRKLRGEEAESQRLGAALPARPVETAEDKEGPPLLLAQALDNGEIAHSMVITAFAFMGLVKPTPKK